MVTGTLYLSYGFQTSVLYGWNIENHSDWRFQYLNRIDLAWFRFIVESKYLALLIVAKKRSFLIIVWYGGNIWFCSPAATTSTSTSNSSEAATSSAATEASSVASATTTLRMKCRELLTSALPMLYKTGQICCHFWEIILMSIRTVHKIFTCYKPGKVVSWQELMNCSGIPHFLIIPG